MSSNGDKASRTLVDSGTKIKGSVESECPIVVQGAVDGDVQGPSLFVSEEGSVSGTILVQELESRGTISGEVEAGRVQLSGTVADETVIKAKTLEINVQSTAGMSVSFGSCELEVGLPPSKEAALATASAVEEPAAATTEEITASAPESETADNDAAVEVVEEKDVEAESASTSATEADGGWGEAAFAAGDRSRRPSQAPPS